MNIDRRIAQAIKRVHKTIDVNVGDALWHVGNHGANVRAAVTHSFNTAARSLGQARRWRNGNA